MTIFNDHLLFRCHRCGGQCPGHRALAAHLLPQHSFFSRFLLSLDAMHDHIIMLTFRHNFIKYYVLSILKIVIWSKGKT